MLRLILVGVGLLLVWVNGGRRMVNSTPVMGSKGEATEWFGQRFPDSYSKL